MSGQAVEPGKRPSLTRLVQMIGEIVAQGEDSGSQSQASGDGGLRAKLRTVLLSLLDGIMGDNAGQTKEVASMLKLLAITLSRSSTLISGDGHSILPEVLERLLPLLTRADLARLHPEVTAITCRILSLLHTTAPPLLAALAQATTTLFEDVCDVAVVMSTQPELSASVACYAGVLRGTDSAEPPLQLQLASCGACESLLGGLLRMMSHLLSLLPLASGKRLAAAPLDRCRTLLLSRRPQLQATAMQFTAAALNSTPLVPCSLDLVLDSLSLASQCPPGLGADAAADEQQEWWQQLLAVLAVLHDRAAVCVVTAELLLPRIHSLAIAAVASPMLSSQLQLQYLQLLRGVLLLQPLLLESSCGQLLQLFAGTDSQTRQLLLQCLELYLHSQQGLCGPEAVREAFDQAALRAGWAAEGPAAGSVDEEGDGSGRSARKRRRLRSGSRRASAASSAADEAEEPTASGGSSRVQAPGPGLLAVASAVAQLAADLGERCRRQQPGVVSAQALASLLGLLAPLAPRQTVALAATVLPAALQPPAGGSSRRRQSMGSEGELTAALLSLTLAMLRAGLVEAAAGAAPASVALKAVPPTHLLALLQRCLQADAAAGQPAALAADNKALALCAGLAAVQAELLDPADYLELLQKGLDDAGSGHIGSGNGNGTASSAVSSAAAAAAALLPAACCISSSREHLLSQPRAVQAGRRQKQQQQHSPSPAVAMLHQLLSGPSSHTAKQHQAVLAAAARGLRCMVTHSLEPCQLVLETITAACSFIPSCDGGSVGSTLLPQCGGKPAVEDGFHPTLSASNSEWGRLALDHLVAAQLPPAGQLDLLEAVAGFLQCSTQGQLEHSKPLVQWLLRQAASPDGAVRGAVLRRAALFAEPQVILAMCHEGEHPIHTRLREAMVESYEAQMLQALREALEGASGAGDAHAGSTGERVREGLVQMIGCVGCLMRSHPAHQLLLGLLITQLDHPEPGLRMLAAEQLLGYAEHRKASLRDIMFASPKLVAFLARQLPAKPELSAELAELLDCSLRSLTLSILPQALPILVADNNRQGLELLAQQAGMELPRLMHDYGHCVVARELFQGSTSFDAYISVLESVTGEDFVLFLFSTMSRTIQEIMAEAGSAEDWGTGTVLPENVCRRAMVTLENLSHVVKGEQELSVAEFLADGDHVTRMLKDWGDSLDRRLPPPHRQAAAAAAAAAAAGSGVEGGGGASAGASIGGAVASGGVSQRQMAAADVRACVTVLRCVLLLTRLAGRFIGRFLPQLMVLLAAGLRPANPREIKLQCLEGWLGLVKSLAAEAPVQLGGVVSQVVVALMDALQEGGAVTAAAMRVVEELVVVCRRNHRDKLRVIPPLPNWLPELERLNETLANERGKLSSQEQIELLIQSLGDESMTVRATTLRELRNLLASRREWALGLLGDVDSEGSGVGDSANSGGGASPGSLLLSRLMSALLKCCEPDVASVVSQQAQQACAECLGMLGAVDPSRLQIELQPPASRCTSDGVLLVTLISRHLVRLLKTAPSLQVLDGTTLAIQELLKHYSQAEGLEEAVPGAADAQQQQQQQQKGWPGVPVAQRSREATPAGAEGNLLFAALAPEVQAIVRPYLDSKYQIRGIVTRPQGTLFGSQPAMSFRKWLFLWLSQLVHHHASGQQLRLFQSVIPVFRFDIPTSLFLMPYLVHNVLAHGTDAARAGVQQEIQAVLAGASSSREGTLCCQACFSLLDTLQKWHGDAKAAQRELGSAAAAQQQQPGGRPGESGQQYASMGPEWDAVHQLLEAMPKQLLAQAASQCGAHARSLQYFETHVRSVHGGALNPSAFRSATYAGDEVSYLQEVYGRLEEPDGLQGLVRLRQGGPRPEDQRLAAEKAGNWSEALTLYEQALQHSGSSGAGGSGSTGAGAGATSAAAVLADGPQGDAGLGAQQRGCLECLLHIGHLQGLLAQVEGLAAGAGDKSAAQLAALGAAASWRLGQWELVEGYVEAANSGFAGLDMDARWEVRIARLLWAVARFDMAELGVGLEAARSEVMGPFSAAAMESYSRAYPQLIKLHMLQEISDVAGALQRSEAPAARRRCLRWEERLRVTQSSLASQEPILALRRQLASLSGAAVEAGECWLQLAKLCRGTGHYEAATTAVLEAVASKVPAAPLEQLALLWDKGQPYRAVSEAQLLVRQAEAHSLAAPFAKQADHSRFHAQVALQLAQWMAETGQAAKDEIVELFERATTLEPKSETVLFRYAVYLDEVMTDARRRQEVEKERGGQKGMDRLQGQARIKLGEDKPFLEILPDVIKSYGMSMMYGTAHTSQSLPRMLTLWFDFGTFRQAFRGMKPAPRADEKAAVEAACASIAAIVTGLAKHVPMHTWLAALPQLISRMCHPCKEVSELAKHIIVKITQAYPHQSLWSLAAVSKSGVAARRAAASAITNSARKGMDNNMFAEMNSFCDQLIRLAAHQPSGKARAMSARKEFNHLVRSMPLRHTVMPAMSALTVTLPASPPTDAKGGGNQRSAASPRSSQQELVTIEGMVDQIEVMHSLQKPKKVTLIGSDGRHYIFLAKPKDDLRKDNRMMEAAGVVNRLFAGDPVARRRNLYLRRFAVLPIGEDNGIVEWVLHTTGIRHCLNEVYSAAGLYDGRTHRVIQKTWDSAPTTKRRAEVLDEVLQGFPPLFHRWQLTKFTEPAAWFNARLAFTRTAAVWSMVGHVVGLGDRHGENILVDCCSGDVVHVDFSCLFDKGLTLQKPEMVPFRLTQNVVDGCGVSGVEGVFRRVCEITLSVLRQHKGSILSVMDTFVHDPLVDWARQQSGAGRSSDEGTDNPYAKDALATIEGRLKGTLLGVSSRPCMPLSVEGQAHRLIEEASSKDNLGMMYIWWMPWM
ncbi:hypothetical protein D9Q98_008728 [Chlorella vulgaris]|uniref:Serine/threonine-protein kinase ATR n=1 Tax=Chlorella vulgaris TaxID=3077 RepID=A0A9D4TII7_CHLVU|nr:hypothetical protein D9Q98_008728 [Chlorella vulgaris]